MRIDREVLLNIAKKTAETCAVDEPWVLAIYLTGSVLDGEPLMGGTADIDLVIIHDEEMEGREIRRITEDIHIDILHHPRSHYKDGRNLRIDPVWGHTLNCCQPLYDPKHFLNIIQTSVRGMYKDPEHIAQRVESQLNKARNTWLEFHNQTPESNQETSWKYLEAVRNCVNSVACLNGGPLTTRSFMLQYKKITDEIGLPGLYQGLLGLLGGYEVEEKIPDEWFDEWKEAFCAASEVEELEELDQIRQPYYFKAVQALSDSGDPSFAFWPMLYTWNLAIRKISNKELFKKWEERFSTLGLTGAGLEMRLEGLDLYLDQVETLVDNWKKHHGIV